MTIAVIGQTEFILLWQLKMRFLMELVDVADGVSRDLRMKLKAELERQSVMVKAFEKNVRGRFTSFIADSLGSLRELCQEDKVATATLWELINDDLWRFKRDHDELVLKIVENGGVVAIGDGV